MFIYLFSCYVLLNKLVVLFMFFRAFFCIEEANLVTQMLWRNTTIASPSTVGCK